MSMCACTRACKWHTHYQVSPGGGVLSSGVYSSQVPPESLRGARDIGLHGHMPRVSPAQASSGPGPGHELAASTQNDGALEPGLGEENVVCPCVCCSRLYSNQHSSHSQQILPHLASGSRRSPLASLELFAFQITRRTTMPVLFLVSEKSHTPHSFQKLWI